VKNVHVDGAWSTSAGRGRPQWITTSGKDELSVTVSSMPVRADIDPTINEQLIVELYSK
jgi:ribosomal protein S4